MNLGKFVGVAMAGVMAMSASAQAGQYIMIKKGKSNVDLEAAIAANDGVLLKKFGQLGIFIAQSDNPNFEAAMDATGGVSKIGVEAVHTQPDVTEAPEAHLSAPTGADDLYNAGLVWGVDRVHAPDAWANGHTGSHDTVVAVIDTGIASNHPDLAPNIVEVNCFTSAGTYADGACSAYPINSDHGTHVAGTVAAAFDGGRVVGVAPNIGLAGYNTFEPIPGCGVCSFSSSRWEAMMDASKKGYKVISMSLGSTAAYGNSGLDDDEDPSPSNGLAAFVAAEKRVARFVNRQGTLMVASAGNSALDLNGTIIHLPGDIPHIMNVGATGIQPDPRYPTPNSFDIRAFYSNYGAALDIAGPGGDCGQIDTCDGGRPANWFEYLVLSTIVAEPADDNYVPGCADTSSCPVGYGWKAGTSMATPHVSAVAALIFDANPGISPVDVKRKLRNTAEVVGSSQDFGHGMVRADRATE